MYEHVLASVVRLNESIAFGGIEPLHCTYRHLVSPFTEKMGFRLRVIRRPSWWLLDGKSRRYDVYRRLVALGVHRLLRPEPSRVRGLVLPVRLKV
jgi:hypothetical protein